MSDTSHSLLARLKSSSTEDSWRQLVELYTPLLRRWQKNYQVQEADCDDLLQEVLTAVVRELPRFEHNARCGAFRNWLRKILVNRLRGYWRGREHRPAAARSHLPAEPHA